MLRLKPGLAPKGGAKNEKKKVCFIGYGSTEYSRNSEASALSYYADAIRDALKQTGINKKEIRGFSITTQASPDYSPHVAEQLGLEVDWVLNGDYGGAGGVMSVRRAADAIECGHLDLAVLVGGNSFDRSTPTQRQLEYQRGNFVDVFGYGGPNSLMALIQRLHMTNYGTTLEQIGKIAVAQRFNATEQSAGAVSRANDHAGLSKLADDFRPDSVIRLRDALLGRGVHPFGVGGKGQADYRQAGLSRHRRGNFALPSRQYAARQNDLRQKVVGERIFSEVKREDIDLFEIYDDYPIAVMIQIEDLGYCKKGEGGKFVDTHDLTYNGDFPVNTGGGELSVGQAGLAGGYLHLVEALRQLRGEAEGHQVKKAARALVTGIGWLNYGRNLGTTAALVMERRK